jgi:orotate phosphoribosyltransferase
VIIDDVMTAGTAIRESIAILKEQPGAKLVGIVQLVDRQERGKGATSTIQEVEAEFSVPVVPIVNLADILAYLKTKAGFEEQVKKIEEYRAEYGIQA